MSKSDVDLIAKAVTNLSKQSPSGGVSDEDIQKIIDGLKSEDVVSLKDRIEYTANPVPLAVPRVKYENMAGEFGKYTDTDGSYLSNQAYKLDVDKLDNFQGVKVNFDIRLIYFFMAKSNTSTNETDQSSWLFGYAPWLSGAASRYEKLHVFKDFAEDNPYNGIENRGRLALHIPEYDSEPMWTKGEITSGKVVYKTMQCTPYVSGLSGNSIVTEPINGWTMHRNFLYAFYETDYVAVTSTALVMLDKPMTVGTKGELFRNEIPELAIWKNYVVSSTRTVTNIAQANTIQIGLKYDKIEQCIKIYTPVSSYNYGVAAANAKTGAMIAYVAAPNKIQYVI